ncbi:hypothetical protein AMTR_s00007p00260740 [Amborella trichopoda]|uniref:Transmembrane protein n=1 Tax=Amborella trichopoda TaxID=13333 RepID=W1PEM8_AMBTC|nr:hypothetical protein AMTR_s00007p00260740 [Amborella trichopoda]
MGLSSLQIETLIFSHAELGLGFLTRVSGLLAWIAFLTAGVSIWSIIFRSTAGNHGRKITILQRNPVGFCGRKFDIGLFQQIVREDGQSKGGDANAVYPSKENRPECEVLCSPSAQTPLNPPAPLPLERSSCSFDRGFSVEFDGSCKGEKYSVYFEGEEDVEEERGNLCCDNFIDGEVNAVSKCIFPIEEINGLWNADLLWYRYQDLTVLNGSVVRLWRRPIN